MTTMFSFTADTKADADLVSYWHTRWWQANREKVRLAKQVRILRRHLKQITEEPCSYACHEGDKYTLDPERPGAECWAKKALKEARAVPYA